MFAIPSHEYRKRLLKWKAAPDYRKVRTRHLRWPAVEHWADGMCKLRAVIYPDGVALFADRGIPGTRRREDHGKIAFTYFGD